jgi:hypothetical protein
MESQSDFRFSSNYRKIHNTYRPFSCFCGTMVLHVNICGLLFVGFSDVIGDNTDIIFGNLKRPQTRNGKEET